jgi:S-adenosylmethionine:tRNA ribosyltransferase-isomerase
MIAAAAPIQRPHDAKLLIIDHTGEVRHHARSAFVNLLRAGDIVVANNAATLPASLLGVHIPTGCPIEVRLAGRGSLELREVGHFYAVVFGAGDFRMRTEDRPLPPALNAGEGLALGPLRSTVVRLLNHPRLVELRFDGSPREIWEGLARHGRPIQYSHIRTPLAVWDTWTAIAGPPVAFEPPSAGFILDWNVLASMTAHRIRFVTVTHAAGISSTGDVQLDALLPLNECYRIPLSTARVINEGRKRGARVIAIGTTVVRALEHAAAGSGAVRAGLGVATQRIGSSTLLRVVDAILTGTHEQGGSHYDLLRAFADEATLRRMDEELEQMNYRTHEFGDSVFLDKSVGMGTPGQPSEIAPACSSWSEIFGGLNLPLRRSVLMCRSISRLLAARRPAQPTGVRG